MAFVTSFTRDDCVVGITTEVSPEALLDYLELTDLLRVLEANMVNQFLRGDANHRAVVMGAVLQHTGAIYAAVMGLDQEGNVVGCDPGCGGPQCRQCQPADQ